MRRLKIVAVQGVIAVVVLETLLRIYNPLPFRLRGDEIVLPAGFHYTRTNNPGPKLDPVTVHTRNRMGFRGPDVPADFPSRLSIVAVGGSTTECFLLSDGKTWPDVMAAELAKVRPDVWVNNAGFDGHSTYGHLVLLRSVLVRLRPSVILFLTGVNDVGAEPGDEPFRPYEFEPANPPTPRIWHRLARYSDLANTILNLVRAWRARGMVFADQPEDFAAQGRRSAAYDATAAAETPSPESLNGYSARLASLARESRAAGIEPVFLTQPTLIGEGIDPTTGVDLLRIGGDHPLNGRAQWRRLEMYNDVMRRVAARDGVFLIDLERRLPKDSRYYYDVIHYGNDGARAVGEIVAAALGPHLQETHPAISAAAASSGSR